MTDMATLIKIDKNGSKHFEGMVKCDRCGGQGGATQWNNTGYTCWKCGGSGQIFMKWIERTPEYEAKLAARRAAKIKAQMAAQEEQRKAYEAKLEAERLRKEAEEAAIKAQKAISQYVGQVGDKITTAAVYDHSAWFEFKLGWATETMYIHTFKDPDGNTLVWKTSSNSLHELDEGDKVQITGTIKDHNEYKDEKQTVLTRCKIRKEGE